MPKQSASLSATGDVCWFATASLRCHVGAVRTQNQDRTGHALGPYGEIFIVADGVGGEAGGAETAGIAVEVYEALPATPWGASGQSGADALQHATATVQQRIEQVRQTQPAFRAMASTAALFFLHGRSATVGHIGDSRIYLCRAGSMRLLTRDHSVVQTMVAEGILTEAEARTHPSGHILTRSLGQQDAKLDTAELELQPDDLILLCSDGLWACLSEEQISLALIHAGRDTEATVDMLLQLALKAGAADNISIVLVRMSPQGCPDGYFQQQDASTRLPWTKFWSRWSGRPLLLVILVLLLVIGVVLVFMLTGR